jgi:hypothetical protein
LAQSSDTAKYHPQVFTTRIALELIFRTPSFPMCE